MADGVEVELLKAETSFLGALGGVAGAGVFLAAATAFAFFASRAFARMSALACLSFGGYRVRVRERERREKKTLLMEGNFAVMTI